jgi:hypothetical protein
VQEFLEAGWEDAIQGASNDYDALGKLYLEAKEKNLPVVILNRISTLGKQLKGQGQ